MSKELCDIALEIYVQTEKAVQVSEDGGKTKVWLPLSQIELEWAKDKKSAVVTLPQWLYEEKGFIS